jgi:hypothetical protein
MPPNMANTRSWQKPALRRRSSAPSTNAARAQVSKQPPQSCKTILEVLSVPTPTCGVGGGDAWARSSGASKGGGTACEGMKSETVAALA